MTAPKTDGTRVKSILGEIEAVLASHNSEFMEIVLLIGMGDQKSAMAMLKPIAHANDLAVRVLTLVRAGQLAAAEDLVMEAAMELKAGKRS